MLRKPLLALLLFSATARLFSQSVNNRDIDARAAHTPFWVNYSPRLLAQHLTKPYTTEEEKVRAIYCWITRHIKYDAKRFQKNTSKKDTPRLILFRKKTLCWGYAALFVELCKEAGIQAIVVDGYVKGITYERDDIFHNVNHSWNLVNISNHWYLLDLTFASGYLRAKPYFFTERLPAWVGLKTGTRSKLVFKRKLNDVYYRTPPAVFIKNHLPAIPAFQLLSEPYDLLSFEQHILEPTAAEDGSSNSVLFDAAVDDSRSTIMIADSSQVFNCRSVLYCAGLYHKASIKLFKESGVNARSGTPTNRIDVNKLNTMVQLCDSSNKLLPTTRLMIAEEAYYKIQKNNHRKNVCNYYLRAASAANRKLLPVVRIKTKNTRRIRYLNRQNRFIQKAIRAYRHKDISGILPNTHIDPVIADSTISIHKQYIRSNTDTIHARVQSIDAWYASIRDSNILSLEQNQSEIAGYMQETKRSSAISAYYRSTLLDNLDAPVAKSNTQRFAYGDSIRLAILHRKQLKDTITLNDKKIREDLRAIRAFTAANLSLMRKNKRLGFYDSIGFNNLIQTVVAELETIKLKNNTLIAFTKQERRWGKRMAADLFTVNRILEAEAAYEKTRYSHRNRFVLGEKKRLLKITQETLKANVQNRKAALLLLRTYK